MMRWQRKIIPLVAAVLWAVLTTACQQGGQLGGFFEETFSITPRCGATDKVLTFMNTSDQTLVIEGIALDAGTNGEGHFSIQGIRVGSDPEIPRGAGGSINEVSVPAGETYALRIRFNPTRESAGDEILTALVDIAYREPEQGIVQVQVSGVAKGEADCPEIIEGSEVGLDGTVNLTINRLVASTNALQEPLSSDNGTQDFIPVTLSVDLNATEETLLFPQITLDDTFFLPPVDPALVPRLASVVFGNTDVTSAGPVTGTYRASEGFLEVPNIEVRLEDDKSVINMTLTFTTAAAPRLKVDVDRLNNAGFTVIDNADVAGIPIQEDGTAVLVASTTVTSAVGPLSSANGSDIVVRIEVTVLCENGTTNCAAE